MNLPVETSRFLRDYVAWELNAICWISLFTVTFLLSQKVFKLFRMWILARKIPGLPCASFSGHCELVSRESLTDVLFNSHKKYGSVTKLWLGPTSLLVSIKDPELIREVLLKAEDKLPLTGKAFRMAFGRLSLFASSFDQVEERRRCLAAVLNQKLQPDRTNIIPRKLVDSILEKLNKNMVERCTDFKTVSQHMSFTLLGSMLFGDAFLDWSKATIYEEILMMIANDACFWASYTVTPFWKREFWRYQRLCTKLKCLTQDILQQCRKNCKLFCQADESFCDKPMKTRNEETSGAPKQSGGSSHSGRVMPDNVFLKELSSHLAPREEPFGNIMGVMLHGFLTTASLIDNILAMLVTHPKIQNRIYSEMVMERKASAKQDHLDVNNLHVLMASIYESARLLPSGPLLQRYSLSHNLSLKNGVIIPAGAIVVVPVQLVHTDHTNWGPDAHEFNPYRFLSKASGADENDTDKIHSWFNLNDLNENIAFLPFGSGKRSCLGEKFVIQETASLFASLLEKYEIKIQTGSRKKQNLIPVTNKSGVFHLLPRTGLVFVQRNG